MTNAMCTSTLVFSLHRLIFCIILLAYITNIALKLAALVNIGLS